MSAPANQPWWSPSRPWGFRFSRSDLFIVLAGVFVVWYGAQRNRDLAILTAFVLGHFFLFCNVFRVGERAELAWAGLLLLNVVIVGAVVGGSWWIALPLQCGVTAIIIARTFRRPDYHGIGCQRINPLGYRPSSRTRSPSLLPILPGGKRVRPQMLRPLHNRGEPGADDSDPLQDASEF